jgi:hypothetical protein
VRYRTHDGETEIALIEWKYVERYSGGPLPGGAASGAVRRGTYERWSDDSGPLRPDRLGYDDVFAEPIYQLFRQHCLAHEMERVRELGADRVRVLVVAPQENAGYWNAVPRRFADDYGDLPSFWRSVLRQPDGFAVLDSSTLVDPSSPCVPSFRERYAHLANGASASARNSPTDVMIDGDDAMAVFLEAADEARSLVQRVFGQGSVLERVTGEDLTHVDAAPLHRAADRLREIVDLARGLRADELHAIDEILTGTNRTEPGSS